MTVADFMLICNLSLLNIMEANIYIYMPISIVIIGNRYYITIDCTMSTTIKYYCCSIFVLILGRFLNNTFLILLRNTCLQ